MLSRALGAGGKAADSAPTTILLGGGGGGGGRGSAAKKVAPSCLVIGLGARWSAVLVRLATVYPGVAPRLPSVRWSLEKAKWILKENCLLFITSSTFPSFK